MTKSYNATLKIDPTTIRDLIENRFGHAFLTLNAPGRTDVTVGYYPISGRVRDAGVVLLAAFALRSVSWVRTSCRRV